MVAIWGTPAACAIGANARLTLLMTAPMSPIALSWSMSLWAALAPTSGEPVSSSATALIVVLTPSTMAPPAALNSSTAIVIAFLLLIPYTAELPVSGKMPPSVRTCSDATGWAGPQPAVSVAARARATSAMVDFFIVTPFQRIGMVWQTTHRQGCGYEDSRREDYDGKRRRLPRMDGYSLQRMTIRKR